MNGSRSYILIAVVAVLVGTIYFINSNSVRNAGSNEAVTIIPRATSLPSVPEKSERYPLAKELAGIKGYINSDAFKLADFVGKKVILIDFWTYSCINCQRTTPYLNSWYEKYKDKGFVIVGVHTPEFEFEKDYANVVSAVKRFGIKYPVVLDSDYGTWNAYSNRYWPREFLVDIDGYIVHDHIGEGNYDETEMKIQELLKERAEVLGNGVAINEKITSPSKDDIQAASPETYFGAKRNEYLANGTPGRAGAQNLEEPATFQRNKLYLSGSWNIMGEYAETSWTGANKIDYKYLAKGVYLVAGSPLKLIEVEVTRDGKPIDGAVKGEDVFYKNSRSYIKVQENRLYKIIEDKSAGEHLLQFIISDPGFQAFAFTFG